MSVSLQGRNEAQASRQKRYRRRDIAAEALPAEAVSYCGKRVIRKPYDDGAIFVRLGDAGADFTGLMTCGSVWHCPVCAAKIAGHRRGQVRRAVDRHRAAGGEVYMATLTVPHERFNDPETLRRAVAEAWRKTLAGRPWVRWRERLALHTIRALEVTYGDHGWHPHLHVLMFVSGEANADADTFGEWLFARWSARVAALGLGECSRDAYRFERARTIDEAADYVAKGVGADFELTHANLKQGRAGGRSPFQLLDDGGAGDTRALKLFQAYAVAFKGARQLTWSKGLKELYDVDDPSDEEVAARPAPGRRIALIYPEAFQAVARAGKLTALLEAVENWGDAGLINFMASMHLLAGVKLLSTTPAEVAA